MADLQQEHHREIEGLLENIRQLSRELRLQMLIIDNFIPQEYQVCMWMHIYATTVLILQCIVSAQYVWLVLYSHICAHKKNSIQQKKLPWSPAIFYFI